MKCPNCGSESLKVLDSRGTGEDGNAIRRRRKCLDCNHIFTTFETPQEVPPQKHASFSALSGMNFTKEDLQNRLLAISFVCHISPTDILHVLQDAGNMAKTNLSSLTSPQADLCILKALRKTQFSYYAAYLMDRFNVKTLSQFTELWKLGQGLTLKDISDIAEENNPKTKAHANKASKKDNPDSVSGTKAIPLFPDDKK